MKKQKKPNKLSLFLSRHEFIEGVYLWKILKFILNCFPIIHIPQRIQRKPLIASELYAVSISATTKARTNNFFLTWETGQPVPFVSSHPILSVFCLGVVSPGLTNLTPDAHPKIKQLQHYIHQLILPLFICVVKVVHFFFKFCLCSLVLTFRFWKTALFRLYDSFAIPISLPSSHCLRAPGLPLCQEFLTLAHFSNIDLSKLPTVVYIWVLDSAYYYTFTI